MPYIKKQDRKKYKKLDDIGFFTPSAGHLNYILTSICLGYLKRHKPSYQIYNEIVGVLECCKLEFYRRAVSEYENLKIKENGDIYDTTRRS